MVQDRDIYNGRLIGNGIWPIKWQQRQWPWMTLKVIHWLQAFSNAIRQTFVQHFTRFQLTVCSHGSSTLAELLVRPPDIIVGGLIFYDGLFFLFSSATLNGNFDGLYLWSETWYRQSVSVLTTTRGLLHRPKTTWILIHKRFQIVPALYQPYVISAFHFIAKLRRRTSANGTQTFAKQCTAVNRVNTLP